MSLSGRIALVTGASRGIGRAIAKALAEDGADVAIHYNRDRAGADETARDVQEAGQRAFVRSASLEDDESLQRLVEETAAHLGPIDILVNNAGIASRGLPVSKTDPAELERVMRVHALAPHAL